MSTDLCRVCGALWGGEDTQASEASGTLFAPPRLILTLALSLAATPTATALPTFFEKNEGQADRRFGFVSRGRTTDLWFGAGEVVFLLKGAGSFRMTFGGRRAPSGEGPLAGRANYFVGRDESGWRTNIETFERVVYRQVWPGIDLVFHGKDGALEYDFVVSAGADPRRIQLAFNGVDALDLDARGDLVISAAGRQVTQQAPRVQQTVEGQARAVSGRFDRLSARRIGFSLGRYDYSRPLVIDPTLLFSTYLGRSDEDVGSGIAVDAAGDIYVLGITSSPDYPVMSTLPRPASGSFDLFVTKLDAAASSLIYSAVIGGSATDQPTGIALDSSGDAVVTGSTNSADFPIRNAAQPAIAGVAYDAFVFKLDPTGSSLIFSTYHGGAASDYPQALAVDAFGNAYLGGYTSSTNFPLIGAFQSADGGYDAFVAKFGSGGARVYSTLLGGHSDDIANGIAVDGTGAAYVAGQTSSLNFPVSSAPQPSIDGGADAFIAKLNPSGSGLMYATYLGGADQDQGWAIAVDGAGNAYVLGSTSSLNFPVVAAWQGARAGGGDLFVAKLNPTGSAFAYATYLGGTSEDTPTAIAVDSAGNAVLAGYTNSTNFPTVAPLQASLAGTYNLVIAQLDSNGTPIFSTYFGGTGQDYPHDIVVDATGTAYVTGYTTTADFPTRNALQPDSGGGIDAFILRIDLRPDGGTAADGGVSDGGSPGDGGALTDGGVPGDAGSASDAGPTGDGGATDAGTTADAGSSHELPTAALSVGCGCNDASVLAPDALALLAALRVTARRRPTRSSPAGPS